MQRRALLRRLGLPAVAGCLTACGFELRGTTDLPFETLHAGFAPASEIGREFRRQIAIASRVKIVERADAAKGRLFVITEAREKEITGFSSSGRPRQFQLRLRFAFRVTDDQENEWIPPTVLLLRRDINTYDTQVVAKELEEAVLYREMTTDLVRQLLRRLAAARPPRPADAGD